MLKEMIKEITIGKEAKWISLKFHETIVQICIRLIIEVTKLNPLLTKNVVLSGGSFHNRYLLTKLVKSLREQDFQVFTHKKVPCSDGGISLGQLIIASEKMLLVKKEK